MGSEPLTSRVRRHQHRGADEKREFHKRLLAIAKDGPGLEMYAGSGKSALANAGRRVVAIDKESAMIRAYKQRHPRARVETGDCLDVVKTLGSERFAVVDIDPSGEPFAAVKAALSTINLVSPALLFTTHGYLNAKVREGITREKAWTDLQRETSGEAKTASLSCKALGWSYASHWGGATIYGAFSLAKNTAHLESPIDSEMPFPEQVKQGLVRIDKAARRLTREYLEEALKLAKRDLPGWAYAMILQEARARAGGRAKHRTDEPNAIEKLALVDIKPGKLRDIEHEDLRAIWLRLHQWYSNAKKKKRAVENIVNAALWTEDEMRRRGFRTGETDLTREIDKLREVKKSSTFVEGLNDLPSDLVVVKDFVSIVGSTAKGKENPADVDVLVRAPWEKDQFQIHEQNVWLPLRNALDPQKEEKLHFIDNPQGAHGDNIPLYDLVLRRREVIKTEVVKGLVKIDLGCGTSKPEGYTGIDKQQTNGVDIVHDLEQGIPLDDESCDEVRAIHFLEHVADKEKIMSEAHRVLKAGGRFVFEVPSTKGEGAFAHPAHKSWWNKSSFAFWAQDELREDRPCFEIEKLDEREDGDRVYVSGVLRKRDRVAKAFSPFSKFVPPKPQVAGFTELFEIEELWKWAEPRLPIAIEPKHNGFRGILEKQGAKQRLWFEGTPGRDRLPVLQDIGDQTKGIDEDFVLDVDVAITKNGKRLPRPELMKLNADKPQFEPGEKIVLTVFDAPYIGEDLTRQPFSERRDLLERFYSSELKGNSAFKLSPIRWAKSLPEARVATRWAFGQDRSEGLVAKSAEGTYELDGATNEWSKLKRVAEIKVIVLDVQRTKAGDFNYWGGLALSKGDEWKNVTGLGGKRYVNLGKSFSTNVEAKKGDILTIEVLELLPDEEKKTLAWLGARVIDVDKARKEPYATAQAIDIARRAKILQKALDVVPTVGPKNARAAFVAASPGKVEVARNEPLTGPAGQTFNASYLKPLDLDRESVVLTNAVPRMLTDDHGRVREPNDDEIKEWRGWLSDELDRLQPHVVVALGQTAKKALGDRADFVLPHPSAIRRFGDSGEIGRKLKAIGQAIAKVHKQRDEEGETRGETAARNWEENWHEMLPTSGKGRFVYQHHWIGLDEDEIKLSDKQLLDTTNALHGDIRLEADGALWGFAPFLGKPADNKAVGGDKLFALSDKIENIQAAPKLPQPKEWLTIGVKKPHIAEPGEPGAFGKSFAKFFALDSGSYELGVVRKHGVEIFLDGTHLQGRYLIQFAPIGGRRIWLIDKPADQEPMAEKKELADLISELRRKRQDFLIWAKPGEKPQKIDVKTGKVAKSFVVPIVKADEERQIVYGVVLDPYGKQGPETDAHGDWIPPIEVEKTAHEWFKASRGIGFGHPGLPGFKPTVKAQPVESHIVEYPSASDYEKARLGEPHRVFRRKYGADIVHSGAWILGTELGDAEWAAFKRGEINAYSVEGLGTKEKSVPRSTMPDVTFVDVVVKQ